MPRRKEAKDVEQAVSGAPVAKGNTAILSVQVQTANGTETHHYSVPNFLGNTLTWQRSGKGFDDILVPALQRAFGGQVEVA